MRVVKRAKYKMLPVFHKCCSRLQAKQLHAGALSAVPWAKALDKPLRLQEKNFRATVAVRYRQVGMPLNRNENFMCNRVQELINIFSPDRKSPVIANDFHFGYVS